MVVWISSIYLLVVRGASGLSSLFISKFTRKFDLAAINIYDLSPNARPTASAYKEFSGAGIFCANLGTRSRGFAPLPKQKLLHVTQPPAETESEIAELSAFLEVALKNYTPDNWLIGIAGNDSESNLHRVFANVPIEFDADVFVYSFGPVGTILMEVYKTAVSSPPIIRPFGAWNNVNQSLLELPPEEKYERRKDLMVNRI